METANTKVIATNYINYNVKQFKLERPAGFYFQAGQAVELSLNSSARQEERRPFTITSLETDEFLEFTIKIYPEHHGFTEQLSLLNAGDELFVHEPFGSIKFKGPGLFIAAGTGITPFLAILRKLKNRQDFSKNYLLFANRTQRDIILPEELTAMLGHRYANILSEEAGSTVQRYIDKDVLADYMTCGITYYYVCGPSQFVTTIVGHLETLGVSKGRIIIEE